MSKILKFLKALFPHNLYYPPTPKPYNVTVNTYSEEEVAMFIEMMEPVVTLEEIAEAKKQAKKKAANAKRAATRKANKLAKEKAQA